MSAVYNQEIVQHTPLFKDTIHDHTWTYSLGVIPNSNMKIQ